MLGGKKQWIYKSVYKSSDETTNKTYAECKHRELRKRVKNLRKVLCHEQSFKIISEISGTGKE